tara:strand:- start:168 stop:347 length:180 start_codon:yes stop_codon:yes gene_type:complete
MSEPNTVCLLYFSAFACILYFLVILPMRQANKMDALFSPPINEYFSDGRSRGIGKCGFH